MNAKSGERKPQDQWVAVEVPPIVSREDFGRVQESLAARAPAWSHPRVISSPVLLTGIARCATCGGGMTLRTGKSGRYRYCTCASAAHRGKAVCPGRSVPMDDLDQLVIGALLSGSCGLSGSRLCSRPTSHARPRPTQGGGNAWPG